MPARKKTTAAKRATTLRPRPRSAAAVAPSAGLSFGVLVNSIRQVHEHCAARANRAVNANLTLRNWVIGGYIHHYELNGQDRADYGDGLLVRLAEHLENVGLRRMDERELRRYRAFYVTYPLIREALSPELEKSMKLPSIVRSLTAQSNAQAEFAKVEPLSPLFAIPGKKLMDMTVRYGQEAFKALSAPRA